jgi:MFS family permease
VFATLLLVGGSIWGACANDYNSLLGARILQGFGTGPFEMLVPASIGDMYFVHQRGKRIAIQAMSMFGVSFLTPIVSGVVTDRLYLPRISRSLLTV